MSAVVSLMDYADVQRRSERLHRRRLRLAAMIAATLVVALAVYGWNYYVLNAGERPFSPKHELLKPSGTVAIKLGILGFGLFLIIFLYPLRKRVKWLGRIGSSRHWLDFHVIAGLTAPAIIAFHASFKFRGIAGIAFWIMLSVAVSGVVGRYVYAQIPRSLSSAEISLKELADAERALTADLATQSLLVPADLVTIFDIPKPEWIQTMPLYKAALLMLALDLGRPFHIARLRVHLLGWRAVLRLGGLVRTSHLELENAIRMAQTKATLAKRIAFLDRSQQVFHLWHVIHRPFSYSFAVLALIHIVVVLALGFV